MADDLFVDGLFSASEIELVDSRARHRDHTPHATRSRSSDAPPEPRQPRARINRLGPRLLHDWFHATRRLALRDVEPRRCARREYVPGPRDRRAAQVQGRAARALGARRELEGRMTTAGLVVERPVEPKARGVPHPRSSFCSCLR